MEEADRPTKTIERRHLLFVMDRSGSMDEIRSDTEGGLRAFMDTQRDLPGKTTVTLRQFDTRHDTVYKNVPLEEVPDYKLMPRGMTALYDAIGTSIQEARTDLIGLPPEELPDEVVVVILTDGKENASEEWTLPAVRKLITEARVMGWTIVFLAADEDAIDTARGMGMSADTAASYSKGNVGQTVVTAGNAVARGTRTGLRGFTEDERVSMSKPE